MKISTIFWLMLLAIVAMAGLAYVDEDREGAAALADFAQEQTTLAESLAGALSAYLSAVRPDVLDAAQAQPESRSVLERYLSAVVHSSAEAERASRRIILLQAPGTADFRATDGRFIAAPTILAALEQGRTYLRLAPSEAGQLGLPARTALAGLAHVDAGPAGRWGIAAVASAERERDRERWARWRLILSVATASGLVLSFGGLAMRNQRKQLLLRHRLQLADLSESA